MTATVHIIPGEHAMDVVHRLHDHGFEVEYYCHGDIHRLTGRMPAPETAHTNAHIARFPHRHRQYGRGALPGNGDGPNPAA
jgi:hypothetical protein